MIARGLHLATLPTCCAECPDVACHHCLAFGIVDIAPEYRRTASAGFCGADVNAGVFSHGHGGGLLQIAATLPIAAHKNRAATRGTTRVQQSISDQTDSLAGNNDSATRALKRRGIQYAGNFGCSTRTCVNDNFTVPLRHASGPDNATVVDNRGKQAICGRSGHDYRAAISFDDTAVGYLCLVGSLVYFDCHQTVWIKPQRDAIAGSQTGSAFGCNDCTGIRY